MHWFQWFQIKNTPPLKPPCLLQAKVGPNHRLLPTEILKCTAIQEQAAGCIFLLLKQLTWECVFLFKTAPCVSLIIWLMSAIMMQISQVKLRCCCSWSWRSIMQQKQPLHATLHQACLRCAHDCIKQARIPFPHYETTDHLIQASLEEAASAHFTFKMIDDSCRASMHADRFSL